MLKTYEAMCVFRPEDETFSRGKDEVRSELEGLGAKIVKEDDMELRTLAYPINGCEQGHYYLYVFEHDPAQVQGVDRALKFKPDLIRFLVVRQEE